MTMFANGQLKRKILQELQQQPRTLADLQTSTLVSLPTLRRALNDLIEMGWIRTVGQNISTGGRPASLFGISGESHIIIGVHAAIPEMNLVAVQIDGEVIHEKHIKDFATLLPDDAVKSVAAYVHEIRTRFPGCNILGIGMAVPGYVDAQTGNILTVGRAPGWENFPMLVRLEAQTSLPIIMENDTDCSIPAELEAVDVANAPCVIYISISEGVKASLLFNGQLFRGPFNNAGLIGRSKLSPNNGADTYHDLENMASVSGLCAIFDQSAEQAPDSTTEAIRAIEDRIERYIAILRCADEKHPICHDIVSHMFEALALSIANLIYILQPQFLFMGGLMSRMPDKLQAQLERQLREELPPLLSNGLIINFASVTGRYASAIGATRLFLQRVVTSDELFEQTAQLTINKVPGQSYG